MKKLIFYVLAIFLIPFIQADTTFFENQNDFFIMGDLPSSEESTVLSGGGGGTTTISNDSISDIKNDSEEKEETKIKEEIIRIVQNISNLPRSILAILFIFSFILLGLFTIIIIKIFLKGMLIAREVKINE